MILPEKTARPPCQVCGSRDSHLFVVKNDLCLHKCQDCGLVYLDPMPSSHKISELYTDAYCGTTTGYFKKADKKLRRARRHLKTLRKKTSGNRFLDIGCNGGFTMEAARENGFLAYGVEIDGASLDYAKKHFPHNNYFHGPIQEYEPSELFDIIYCSEVIEHVDDANSFVAAAARLMNAGSLLYMTTPDISHWRRPRDINKWDAFCPPSHCLYFNPSNLTKLLFAHNLHVIKVRWAWKPGIRLYARLLP